MSGKAEYVLDICEEMCYGPIPKHRTDKELLTFYAKRIRGAYIHKVCELEALAQSPRNGKDRPSEIGLKEVYAWLDAKIEALEAELAAQEEER